MRWPILISLSLWALVSCESTPTQEELDAAWTPPEQRGERYVEIGDDWKIEADSLHVERDHESRRLVLRASGQGNVTVSSLTVPKSSQVMTTATAREVYFNSFTKRFELVGSPVVRQGQLLTQPVEVPDRMWLLTDGTVKTNSADSAEFPLSRDLEEK